MKTTFKCKTKNYSISTKQNKKKIIFRINVSIVLRQIIWVGVTWRRLRLCTVISKISLMAMAAFSKTANSCNWCFHHTKNDKEEALNRKISHFREYILLFLYFL